MTPITSTGIVLSALCCACQYGNRQDFLPCSLGGVPDVEEGIKAGTCFRPSPPDNAGVFCEKNVIILCDSWYVKHNLVSVVDEYENLDRIGNARADSVVYDLAPAHRQKGQACKTWPPSVHRYRLYPFQ